MKNAEEVNKQNELMRKWARQQAIEKAKENQKTNPLSVLASTSMPEQTMVGSSMWSSVQAERCKNKLACFYY